MARRRLATVLSLAATFAASAPERALADAELSVGVETAVEYDDNVLYDDEVEEDDGILRIRPLIQAYDRRGEFQWDVHYYPSYEKFFSLGELDGWDHDAAASVTWQPSERTYLRVSDSYVDFKSAVRFAQSVDVAEPGGDVEATLGRQGFTQNVASADFSHRFLPRHVAQMSVTSVINEGDPLDVGDVRNENQVTSASIGWRYDFSTVTQAGLTIQGTRQEVERALGDESRTDFYNVGIQIIHQFSPTFYVSAAAGPTLVRFEEQEIAAELSNELVFPQIRPMGVGVPRPVLVSTCGTLEDGTPVLDTSCQPAGGFLLPPNDVLTTNLFLTGDLPEQDTDDITYFANVSLVKRWSTLTASLRYVRDASTSSNFSGEVRDVVSFTLRWTPDQRWRVTFSTSWENRDQTQQVVGFARTLVPATVFLLSDAGVLAPFTDIGVASGLRAVLEDSDLKDTRYIVSANAEYRLTKRVTLFSNVYYIRQETSTTGLANREIDRVDIVVGVRFYFDPIQLPI